MAATPDTATGHTCPLCGGANACALAQGNGQDCWCEHATFSPELLAQIPPAQRGISCLCAECASKAASPPGLGHAKNSNLDSDRD